MAARQGGHGRRARSPSHAEGGAGRLVLLLVVLLGVLAPVEVSAQSRTAFLVDRLKSPDLRVRTQAALALGGTADDAAVAPLCGVLGDESDVVRQASAAALKRLNKTASLDCLRPRLDLEKSESVRLQLTRAIEAIETSGEGPSAAAAAVSEPGGDTEAPKLVANAKYYVALSPITNNSGRSQQEIDRLVGGAIRQKLDAIGGYQLAPSKETPEVAKAVIAKRKLKGYYLSISVEKFGYEGGNLRVRVKIAVFSYPGKDLRGEVPAGLTQTGVSAPDKGAEDNLLGMAGGRAAELFTQSFP